MSVVQKVMALLLISLFGWAATFEDPAGRFRISFQEPWEVSAKDLRPEGDRGQMLPGSVLVGIQRKQADDGYHPRFSVVMEDARRFNTSEIAGQVRYKNYVVDFLKDQRFQIISQKTQMLVSGLPAFEITAFQRDFGLTYRQWAVMDGPRAFLLTAAARVKRFESYEVEIGQIMRSFELLKTVRAASYATSDAAR